MKLTYQLEEKFLIEKKIYIRKERRKLYIQHKLEVNRKILITNTSKNNFFEQYNSIKEDCELYDPSRVEKSQQNIENELNVDRINKTVDKIDDLFIKGNVYYDFRLHVSVSRRRSHFK